MQKATSAFTKQIPGVGKESPCHHHSRGSVQM